MILIRCTHKLLAELRTKPQEFAVISNPVGDWYANLIRIERRKCVLVTNGQTLFSLFLPAFKRPDFDNFSELFKQRLFKAMLNLEIPQKNIERILTEIEDCRIGKTNSRSVLGSMNDFAVQVKSMVDLSGGLNDTDIMTLNSRINEVPMGALKYGTPMESFLAVSG